MFKKMLLVCLLLLTTIGSQAAEPLKLGIITLSEPNHTFWSNVESLMEEACRDLGMTLERYYALEERGNMLRSMRQAHADGVDALVFPNFKESAMDMLELSEQLNLPVFLINADINERNKTQIGKPREKFNQWLGRMLPNDQQAGYLLGKQLIEAQLNLYPEIAKNRLEIVAITGAFHDSPSALRIAGLKEAIAEYDFVILNQVVYAQWSTNRAYTLAGQLLERYPDTRVIWTASDDMALGVMRLLQETEEAIADKLMTGGVDWTTGGIKMLGDVHYVASIGGHVMEGAWSAVLLYDYLHGFDFAKYAVDFNSAMSGFDSLNTNTYLDHIERQDWSHIDFTRFSRFLNPSPEGYAFNPDVLFRKE